MLRHAPTGFNIPYSQVLLNMKVPALPSPSATASSVSFIIGFRIQEPEFRIEAFRAFS
jgi:hypothetical protein